MNPPYLRVFLQYFLPALLVVAVMLGRITLLKGCLFVVRAMIASLIGPLHRSCLSAPPGTTSCTAWRNLAECG